MSVRARVACGALALAAAGAAWHALQVGLAHSEAQPVHDLLVAAARGDEVDAVAWYEAEARLARALARHRAADLLELHGRTLLLGAYRLESDQASAWRRRAVISLREAFARRPRWPYAASALATAKAEVGEFDPEFDRAVLAAHRFGPREARIGRQLARLRVDPRAGARREVSAVLDAAFDAALADKPARWIDLADRAGTGAWACSRPRLPGRATARCTELGWLPAATPRG
jgi:hypothetical protein